MNKLYRIITLFLNRCQESTNATSGMTSYESLPKKAKLIRPEYPSDKKPEVYNRKYFRKKKEVTS